MSVRPKHPTYRHSPSTYVPPDRNDPSLARNVMSSKFFKAACEAFGVAPTIRQARKFNARSGRWAPNRVVAA